MVNQAFDDPDIEEVITNVDTKPKNAKVRIFKLYHTATRHSTTLSTNEKPSVVNPTHILPGINNFTRKKRKKQL